ncbi:DUF4738 domain-containing protein [Alistipes sp. kh20]|uniref:DUF4738 domain-containing protein n=1 Tax=Alistipes montrealensis TaxID=2834113 RepID=UPI001BCD0836|nr:DUF4738 domain-containing protein [Alistipes montrealensis]MBS4765967.1 DUF4738 domain-containing protein [Alistipes montrealensis]
MKQLFLISFAILFIGCISNTGRRNAIILNSDSTSLLVDIQPMHNQQGNIFDSIIQSPPFVIDTIIHPFHISYIIRDNDDIIATDHYAIADRSIILSVEKAGEILISNKEIRKQNFDSIIPREFFNKVQLYTGIIWEHNDENIVILINICVPDTDICCPILLSIDSLGHFSAREEILDDME